MTVSNEYPSLVIVYRKRGKVYIPFRYRLFIESIVEVSKDTVESSNSVLNTRGSSLKPNFIPFIKDADVKKIKPFIAAVVPQDIMFPTNPILSPLTQRVFVDTDNTFGTLGIKVADDYVRRNFEGLRISDFDVQSNIIGNYITESDPTNTIPYRTTGFVYGRSALSFINNTK